MTNFFQKIKIGFSLSVLKMFAKPLSKSLVKQLEALDVYVTADSVSNVAQSFVYKLVGFKPPVKVEGIVDKLLDKKIGDLLDYIRDYAVDYAKRKGIA